MRTDGFGAPKGWWMPMALAAAVVLSVVAELGFRSSSAYVLSLRERSVARIATNSVLRRLLDAETAQRGYLLTGRAEYLTPGARAAADIAESLATLDTHYASDLELRPRVDALRVKVDEKLSEISTLLTLYQKGEHERWHDLLLTDIGRERMDAVRSSAHLLLAAEDRRAAREWQAVQTTLLWSRYGLHTLTLVCLVGLVFYLRKVATIEAVQRRHALELQAERNALEVQVQLRTAELAELAAHLQTVREDERSLLARELHDEMGALLTAAKLDAARLKRALGPLTEDQAQRLHHLNLSIDQGITLKRRIIEDLRPSALGHLGLKAALEIQAREFAKRSNLPVTAEIEAVRLGDAGEITAYRVMQESFTNIAKYADASAVQVSLVAEGSQARLVVQDDGKGFDTSRRRPSSHGLTGMRYRVESLGGSWRVVSAPGQGTRIEALIPLRPEGTAA